MVVKSKNVSSDLYDSFIKISRNEKYSLIVFH